MPRLPRAMLMVVAENVGGDLIGRTSNGNVDISSASGAIEMLTSNASIKAGNMDGKGRGIRLATTNGNIDVALGKVEGVLEAITNREARVAVEVQNVQPVVEGRVTRVKIGGSSQPIVLQTSNGRISVK